MSLPSGKPAFIQLKRFDLKPGYFLQATGVG